MSAVKFSVVIPTRERAATLRHALRTCLDQTFADYEIIVSDNDSSPATRAVVDEAASPKVRYVRTPGLLAMSSNWDFAVSHARGEYVIIIGDDDGLLPHALTELDKLTRERSPKAIRWEAAYYTWPTIALPGQGNYLRVPLGRGLREVESAAAIREVIAFRAQYTTLPMLYNAAVHRSVIDELRAKTGRVFPHPIPDVYSGFAVAHAAGRFLSTDAPMTVSGQSGASNGIAMLFHRGRSPIDKEYHSLNRREGLLPDPRVPDLPVFPHVPVADTFTFAKRAFFSDSPLEVDRRRLTLECVVNLRVESETDWQAALGVVRASLTDNTELLAWFDRDLAGTPFRPAAPLRLLPDRLGADNGFLHLDAATFGVADVAAAAMLCDRLLNYRRDSVAFTTDEETSAKTAPGVALVEVVEGLKLQTANQQQVIEGLHRSCEERLELIRQQHARLLEFERGGPMRRAGRWVKQRMASAFRLATLRGVR